MNGAGGWIIGVREDSATDALAFAPADQNEFAFVYIPYTALNFVGSKRRRARQIYDDFDPKIEELKRNLEKETGICEPWRLARHSP